MKKTKKFHNSKQLYKHAIPVVMVMLAFMLLSAGFYLTTGSGFTKDQLGGALTRHGVTLSPSSGGVHMSLSRAKTAPPAHQNTATPTPSAEVGQDVELHQALRQAASNAGF